MPRSNKTTSEKLGKTIAKLRKEKGLTQEDLARKVDTARAYIAHIETGIKTPSLETMEKIAKVLKIHMSDLFK